MKILCATLLGLGFALPVHAAGPTLSQARERWLHGNYRTARNLYEALLKDPASHDGAVLGLTRTLESQGDYDQALHTLDAALADAPKSADLHAQRAETLYLRGRRDEAETAADRAVALKDDSFLARWVRAQIYRDRTDDKRTDAELRWFIHTYSSRSDQDKDIKDPDELLLVGLAGAENARRHKLADQFTFILNDVYGDALKADKAFWPAEYQAGALLLEKYNRGEALASFEKALAINPRAALALVGMGKAALQQLEFRSAEQFAERALKINPKLQEALQLRADVYLATGDTEHALLELARAGRVNPNNEETLARAAACRYLQHRPDEVTKLARQVEAFDPRPGRFYFILADRIEEHFRFDDAEKYYEKAVALRPLRPAAEGSLGLLYMRLGREKDARTTLSKAFAADPFNVRVSNSLKVLRHLDKYETVRTAHFMLRFDPKNDGALARYMTTYLEQIYEDLARRFGYRPRGPILIEVFNNHTMFSGRVIAVPDLFTIGASTGRMFAMVSPHGKGIAHPFNWARVLRHELTHVFNLEQTDFQVPHWFTEGLAVTSEGFPRPQEWNEELLERVPAGQFIKLDSLNLGFIRPRTAEERSFSYCESALYIEYLTKTYGSRAESAMLAAYKDGLDTRGAIARVCKVDQDTLERNFQRWVEGTILPAIHQQKVEKPISFAQLRQTHAKEPANADIAARLAEQYLERGNASMARKLADEALKQSARQPRAVTVKAQLLQAAGDGEGSLRLLQGALDAAHPDVHVAAALGKLYFEAKDFGRAAGMYELAHRSEPYERQWLVDLARVYVHSGDTAKRIETLKALVPTDADDLDSRKRLAELLESRGQHPEAERYARQALEIDVVDAGVQKILGDALLGQKKYPAAVEAYSQALAVNPRADDARLGLARTYLALREKDKARNEVGQVLLHDPDNDAARALRDTLKK